MYSGTSIKAPFPLLKFVLKEHIWETSLLEKVSHIRGGLCEGFHCAKPYCWLWGGGLNGEHFKFY